MTTDSFKKWLDDLEFKKLKLSPKEKQIFISAYLGNCLETYDYVLLGTLLPLLSSLFIDDLFGQNSLIYGLFIFFVGGLARPLGSLFWGYVGDKHGRRRVLFLTLTGMSICSLGIALLPSYEKIGWLSALLFFLFRIGQGFSIGGEGLGSGVYCLESLGKNQEGRLGAIYATSNGVGALLAIILSAIYNYGILSENGWRVLFMLGALVGIFGIRFRRKLPDSPAFLVEQENVQKGYNPLKELILSHKISLLIAVLFVGIAGSLTYIGFTFLGLYLQKVVGVPAYLAMVYATISVLLSMMAVYFFRHFLDKVDERQLVIYSSIFIICTAVPMMFCFHGSTPLRIFVGILLLSISTGVLCGFLPAFLSFLFPTKVRYSGASISGNVGQAVIGNAYPFFAFWLISATQNELSPALLLILPAVAILILLSFIQTIPNYKNTEGLYERL